MYAVEMPPELAAGKSRVWRLKKVLLWSERNSTLLAGTFCGSYAGTFLRLLSDNSVCVQEKLFVLAHVDELIVTGTFQSRAWFFSKLREIFVIKHVTWLDATSDSAMFVGKKVVLTDNGYEAFVSSDYIKNTAEVWDV